MSIKASVIEGRLVVDEPTNLPNGTVVDLVIDDEGDDLDAAQVAQLNAAIARSLDEAAHGDVVAADVVLAGLREGS